MSYENAPATKLLATHCAICERPLVDAESVETGLDPHCRKQLFKGSDKDAPNRETANKLIYVVAACRSTGDVRGIVDAINGLHALGFSTVADKLAKAVATIKIELSTIAPVIYVKTPYVDTKDWHYIVGQRWEPTKKARIVPVTERVALYRVLMAHWPNHIGLGPKGLFIVGVTT